MKCVECNTNSTTKYCSIRCQLVYNSVTIGDCRLWVSYTNNGYGNMFINTRPHRVHVIAYKEFIGKNNGKRVYQTCGMANCIEPEHLTLHRKKDYELGTDTIKHVLGFINRGILTYHEICRIYNVPINYLKALKKAA